MYIPNINIYIHTFSQNVYTYIYMYTTYFLFRNHKYVHIDCFNMRRFLII